jgi:flagellar biosynthesis protein
MPTDERHQRTKQVSKAVALGYSKVRVDTPVILASGSGDVAARIVEIAELHGIYIREDELLAESLSRLKLGQAIPPELYKAVAKVLAFVYSLDAAADKEPWGVKE